MSHHSFPVFALILLLILPATVFAQDFKRTFGDITIEDFKQLPDDSSEAVVLFEVGKAEIDPYRGTTLKVHKRTKILRPSGANKYGGNAHFLVRKRGLSKPVGATYNLVNGRIEKSDLPETSIFKGKFNRDYDEIKVAFPNVREGSIVEIQYTLRDDDMFMPNWKFQEDIPVLRSEYSFHVPIEKYATYLSGELKPDKHEIKYENKYQYWLMTNVPAFKEESMMPEASPYKSKVQFGTTYLTWPAIHARLITDEMVGGQLGRDKNFFLKDKVRQIVNGVTDSVKMIQAISDCVKQSIGFDETNDFVASDLKELFDKKKGSSGDINILLAAMLKRAGFKVSLVLLSTRANGHIMEAFTSTSQFDYVIVEASVNGKEIFLDATDQYLPYDMLPDQCLNHKGFLVANNQFGWVPVEPTQRDKVTVDANLILDAQGALKGQIRFDRHGYAGYHARKLYRQKGETEYVANSLNNKNWNVSQHKIEDVSDIYKPLGEVYGVEITDYTIVSGNTIYINPHIFLREKLNPFTASSRKYPIDFGLLKDHMAMTTITLPDGYDLESVPENKVFALPQNLAKCTINFTKVGNKVTVISRVQINRTLFQPDEYQGLKELYTRLIAKKAESLVVVKK